MTVRSSRAQRARSGEIHTRARREAGTSPVRGQPSTSAAGSTSGRGSNVSSVTVADLIRSSRKWRTSPRDGSKLATYQPSRPLISAYGSTSASGELVLVLLVVLEREQPPGGDRAGDDGRDLGIVAARGGDLKSLVGRVLAERGDDLLADRGERAFGDVLADQVDRGDQRLRLDGQQPRRAGERVAVRLGVDLDRAVGAGSRRTARRCRRRS